MIGKPAALGCGRPETIIAGEDAVSTDQRLVSITTVRNEADVIEAFVRHTATFVHQVVVLDNGSTDATRRILDDLAAHGCPLLVLSDGSIGNRQWQRMTRLMREVAAGQLRADWILPLDADEFIVPAGDASLAGALARASGPVHVPWVTYVPHPSDDVHDRNPATRLRHRASAEASWQKVFVPGALATRDGVRLSQGSHDVELGGVGCAAERLTGVHLAHLPVRDPAQFASKIAVSQLQLLAMHDGNPAWGRHIRRFYDALKADGERFGALCNGAALDYAPRAGQPLHARAVHDPFPYRGGPLRFTPRTPDPPLRAVLEYSEQLARAYAGAAAELSGVAGDEADPMRAIRAIRDRQTALDEQCVQAERRASRAEQENRRLRAELTYRLAAAARALWYAAGRAVRADLKGAARQWETMRTQFRGDTPGGES
jgi:hypothetical protein